MVTESVLSLRGARERPRTHTLKSEETRQEKKNDEVLAEWGVMTNYKYGDWSDLNEGRIIARSKGYDHHDE